MKNFSADAIRREVALVEQIAEISRADCEAEARDFVAISNRQTQHAEADQGLDKAKISTAISAVTKARAAMQKADQELRAAIKVVIHITDDKTAGPLWLAAGNLKKGSESIEEVVQDLTDLRNQY